MLSFCLGYGFSLKWHLLASDKKTPGHETLMCDIMYTMSMIFHHPLLTCTVVVTVNHFNSPHSMYYNILTGLQTGFRVKIVNFDNSVVSQFPEET